jgi:hypothetical protein
MATAISNAYTAKETRDMRRRAHCIADRINDIAGTVECSPFHRTRWLLGLSSDELPWGAHPER